MTVGRPLAKDAVAALLVSALGQEKSEELVAAAARGLGVSLDALSPEDVRAIFHQLAGAAGLVGVVARFAISRGDVEELVARTSAPPSSTRAVAVAAAPAVDLAALLAPALGAEKARDAISGAAARLGLDPHALSHDDAIAVLDELTRSDGMVGVVARFAKARVLLT